MGGTPKTTKKKKKTLTFMFNNTIYIGPAIDFRSQLA